MKIPYITINWDQNQRRFVVGFGVYRLGIGNILWCADWETFCDFWIIL